MPSMIPDLQCPCAGAALLVALLAPLPSEADLLPKQSLLDTQTFWDNRDWDWYRDNIPFLETPDPSIDTTYYYRWEVVTKHMVYGSPEDGYSLTEFIDRPGWSRTYGAIVCPAGHQLYEVRWLRTPRLARDYARYWFRTPGAQPRRYSSWLVDAVWAVQRVHPDDGFTAGLLDDVVRHYREWERSHFVPGAGMFWQHGMADGMETSITSRQTKNWFSGAPGFRPTLNSYLHADARAVARIARLAGKPVVAREYDAKAAALKKRVVESLWDPGREFFFHMFRDDEEKDGDVVKAGSLTYQTGKFAGSEHGRELLGYVPWQFHLPDDRHGSAWRFLMDPDYFFARFGPTVTERHDPLFLISRSCCVWSGQSWPFATTQTLAAMANLLNDYDQDFVDRADYLRLLKVYARTHQKDDRPYIAEATHPDSGSWSGHDHFNHSEHYFHSAFVDLVITGLIGLRPRDDDVLEVNPLAPGSWDWFALEDVPYKGHDVTIVWDRAGRRYALGAGLHLLVDGKRLASSTRLEKIEVELPPASSHESTPAPPINYAVNNSGRYFPKAIASSSSPSTPTALVNDGQYWYHVSPPNRWTAGESESATDWCGIDFGAERPLETVKLYFLDDEEGVVPPSSYELEHDAGNGWTPVPEQTRALAYPEGRRANTVRFPMLRTRKLRAVFRHGREGRTGLSELEAWGPGAPPIATAPPPRGNLAVNTRGEGFPKASASWTSRFDRVGMVNDGLVFLRPSPHNRWTAYESSSDSDWVEIDFGAPTDAGRVELHIYDDNGGVRAPESYDVQVLVDGTWKSAGGQLRRPQKPAGGTVNTVRFRRATTRKLRVVFKHRGRARSGLSEIEVWKE